MTRTEKDWIFVSDAHFTGREPEAMEVFLNFLNSEKERMSHLVILGDLFEFFFGFKGPDPSEESSPFSDYLPILKGLQGLYHQGIRIKYFEGNHDFFINSFFFDKLGIQVEVYPEGSEERLGGRRAFISHGDLSNPELWSYRVFRRMIRNRWTYNFIQMVGPGFSRRIARRLSERSYQKCHACIPPAPPPEFKAFAHQKFLEGFDLVILGHSHFPERVEESVEGKRHLYFNTGDWMTHRSFLRFTPPDHFEMGRWGDN